MAPGAAQKRLLVLLSLAALCVAVGKVGFCRHSTNIGSRAWLAPLPGTLGSTAWTPTKPQSPTWPWTTSALCTSLRPWTSSWCWTSTTTCSSFLCCWLRSSSWGFHEGLIQPFAQQPASRLQRVASTNRPLQQEVGHSEEEQGSDSMQKMVSRGC